MAGEARRVGWRCARVGRGARQALDVEADASRIAVLEVASPSEVAELAIEVEVPADDPAPATGIGVVALMACAPDDLAARLDFLERLRFVWPEPA